MNVTLPPFDQIYSLMSNNEAICLRDSTDSALVAKQEEKEEEKSITLFAE